MGAETMTLEQLFAQYSATELNIAFVALIIGSLFAAFFGFRFFKLTLILSGASYGYTFGTVTLGMFIGDLGLAGNLVEIFGIVCAVIFAILMPKFYKALIYFTGGIFGAMLGFVVPYATLVAFDLEMAGIIVGLIVAILVTAPSARFLYRIFKPYIIFSTSLCGMVLAFVYLSMMIFGANETMLGLFVLIGAVLSVFAMKAQTVINRGREFDL